MSRQRTFIFACVATLLGLLVLEGVARLLLLVVPERPPAGGLVFRDVWTHDDDPLHMPDRDLFWKPVPGRVVGEARINRDGCRGPEIAATKPPGVRRILLAGDSVTFGWGVPENASFAGRLRQDLGTSFEVIDAGAIGYSSWQGRRLLATKLARWQPDLVVVLFGYNDHHSAALSDRDQYARRRLESLAHAAARSAIYQLASRLAARWRKPPSRPPVARVSVDDFEANLLAIDALCRKAGAHALFLTVPLRPVLPLVENFVAVRDPSDHGAAPVWVRQIDFACQQMDEPASSEIASHFFDGEGLESFIARPGDCERIAGLSALAPDLPVFRYLIAQCLRGSDPARAAQALNDCRRLDRERVAMEAYNSSLRALGAAQRLEVQDLASLFAASNQTDLFLDVVHPNAAGHALVASAIEGWLLASAPAP